MNDETEKQIGEFLLSGALPWQRFRQRGVVLVGSMIMLAAAAVVGSIAVQESSMERKQASNFGNDQQLLQAAEATLKEGEKQIRLLTERPTPETVAEEDADEQVLWIWNLNRPHPDSDDSEFTPDISDAWWAERGAWWDGRDGEWWQTDTDSHAYPLGTLCEENDDKDIDCDAGVEKRMEQFSVDKAPLYVIEHERFLRDDYSWCSYENPCPGRDIYRVTVRVEGNRTNDTVMLQSSYSWRFE